MKEKKQNINATHSIISASIYEIMLTSEMFRYYQVYPKYVMQEFAVFFCLEDMAEELKLELEVILGIQIKFENLPKTEFDALLSKDEKSDFILY